MRRHVPQRQAQKSFGSRRVNALMMVAVAAAVILASGAVAARRPAMTEPATTVVAGGSYPEFTPTAPYVHINLLAPGNATPPSVPVVIDGSTASPIPADRGSAVEATAAIVNRSLPINLRASRPSQR